MGKRAPQKIDYTDAGRLHEALDRVPKPDRDLIEDSMRGLYDSLIDEREREAITLDRSDLDALVRDALVAGRAAPTLSRREAAALCGVSLRQFDDHVAPHLEAKRIGRRVVYNRSALLEWLATPKATGSGNRKVATRTLSVSGSTESVSKSPRALRIKQRLSARQKKSTQTPSNDRHNDSE